MRDLLDITDRLPSDEPPTGAERERLDVHRKVADARCGTLRARFTATENLAATLHRELGPRD